jgi:hypothetical protein
MYTNEEKETAYVYDYIDDEWNVFSCVLQSFKGRLANRIGPKVRTAAMWRLNGKVRATRCVLIHQSLQQLRRQRAAAQVNLKHAKATMASRQQEGDSKWQKVRKSYRN